jgi:hypothetical protein
VFAGRQGITFYKTLIVNPPVLCITVCIMLRVSLPLFLSPYFIPVIKSERKRWAGYVVRVGDRRDAYRDLGGRSEGNIPCGIPRCRWKDNIKIDLQQVGWEGVDWIDLAQDRDRWRALVIAVMNLQVPTKRGSFLTS